MTKRQPIRSRVLRQYGYESYEIDLTSVSTSQMRSKRRMEDVRVQSMT